MRRPYPRSRAWLVTGETKNRRHAMPTLEQSAVLDPPAPEAEPWAPGPPPAWTPPEQTTPPPPPRRRRPWRIAAAFLGVALVAGSAGGVVTRELEPSPTSSTTVVQTASSSQLAGDSLDVAQVVAKVEPAVVSIQASTNQGPFASTAAGSGIILTSDGEVLTNAHVVNGASSIKVTLNGQSQSRTATLVGIDTSADLALLKITGASGLPTVTIGKSSEMAVGDDVVAIGNALALQGRPTVEVVVPVYNEEQDLERCVRRLHAYLCSSFPFDYQVTIADNASTDGTWPLAQRLAGERELISRCYNLLLHATLGSRFSDASAGSRPSAPTRPEGCCPGSAMTAGSSTPSCWCSPNGPACASTRCRSTGSTTPTRGSTFWPPPSPTCAASPGSAATWCASRSSASPARSPTWCCTWRCARRWARRAPTARRCWRPRSPTPRPTAAGPSRSAARWARSATSSRGWPCSRSRSP